MSHDAIRGIPLDAFFLRNGEIWKVSHMCERPTMTLENVKTGERVGGAIGAPIFADFVRLVPVGGDPE